MTHQPHITINKQCSFQTSFRLDVFIHAVCKEKNIQSGQLEFSFVDKTTITQINTDYLNHHYATDTISFNLGTEAIPEADIYICIPVAKENALEFNHSFEEELKLLIIHTILHTIGYTDYTETEKLKMDQEQNRILMLLSQSHET